MQRELSQSSSLSQLPFPKIDLELRKAFMKLYRFEGVTDIQQIRKAQALHLETLGLG